MTTIELGDLPALRIGEIVLRTNRYEAMKRWYRAVLEVDPHYEHIPVDNGQPHVAEAWASQIRLCFFRLVLDHPYQQVVALFEVTGTGDATSEAAGLHHMQLRDQSAATFARRCARLQTVNIEPFRAMNHGPTTSCYYRDPDRNVVEIAVANYQDVEQFLAAGQSEEFRRNPSGRPLDIRRFLDVAQGDRRLVAPPAQK